MSSINKASSPFSCICLKDFSQPFLGIDFGFRIILPFSKTSSNVSLMLYCSNTALGSLMPFEFPVVLSYPTQDFFQFQFNIQLFK